MRLLRAVEVFLRKRHGLLAVIEPVRALAVHFCRRLTLRLRLVIPLDEYHVVPVIVDLKDLLFLWLAARVFGRLNVCRVLLTACFVAFVGLIELFLCYDGGAVVVDFACIGGLRFRIMQTR